MNENLTELVFILDRSGSMGPCVDDTIGGFNAFLEKQKAITGECRVTTALFDQDYNLLHDRIDIQAISPISAEDYYVGGTTALYDALGKTINKIAKVQKITKPELKAKKVLFIIITDGYENSSKEFTAKQIKQMVEKQQEDANWEFIFLGANMDAICAAGNIGIKGNRARNYTANPKETRANYDCIHEVVQLYRTCGTIPDDWNKNKSH